MLSKGSTESLSTIKPNLVQSCSCLVLFTLLTVFESFLSITSNKRTTSPPRCTVPILKFCFDVYSLFTNIKANRKKLNRFHWYWVALSPSTNVTHLRELQKTDWHVIPNRMLFWIPSYPRREEVSLQWAKPDLTLSASSHTLLVID